MGEVRHIETEVVSLLRVTRVAGEDRSRGAVDVHVQLVDRRGLHGRAHRPPERGTGNVGIAGDGHAREVVPVFVAVRSVGVTFRIEHLHELVVRGVQHAVGDRDAPDQHDRDGGQHHARPAARIHGEQEPSERTEPTDGHHRAGPVEVPQQYHEADASDRRPEQVGCIQAVHLLGKAGEREAHHDTAEDERDRDDQADDAHRRHAFDPPIGGPGEVELYDEARRHGHGEQQGEHPQLLLRCRDAEPARREVDEQRADGHAEQRDRDRDEREVVTHRGAEDARQADLVHNRREGDHAQSDVRRRPWPRRLECPRFRRHPIPQR